MYAIRSYYAARLPAASYDVLVRGELPQPHRSARMQPVGADADLGAEAELEAVGEARGGVGEDRGGIDLREEALGRAFVARDDRLREPRAMARDEVVV